VNNQNYIKIRCPHCERKSFSRVRRGFFMRLFPYSKSFRCDNCSWLCHNIMGMNFFKKIDLIKILNTNCGLSEEGQRAAQRHRLPLRLKVLKVLREGEEVEIESDSHIYSLNFSATGIAVRTDMVLNVDDHIYCKAQYHEFYIEAVVRRSFINKQNGIVYGCSLLGGGFDNMAFQDTSFENQQPA
jgi:hypothetical protein